MRRWSREALFQWIDDRAVEMTFRDMKRSVPPGQWKRREHGVRTLEGREEPRRVRAVASHAKGLGPVFRNEGVEGYRTVALPSSEMVSSLWRHPVLPHLPAPRVVRDPFYAGVEGSVLFDQPSWQRGRWTDEQRESYEVYLREQDRERDDRPVSVRWKSPAVVSPPVVVPAPPPLKKKPRSKRVVVVHYGGLWYGHTFCGMSCVWSVAGSDDAREVTCSKCLMKIKYGEGKS